MRENSQTQIRWYRVLTSWCFYIGAFLFVWVFINFSCHKRQEKLQKKRRLRGRGFRKKKAASRIFSCFNILSALKNSPLRFDDWIAFNLKSRLRRPSGVIAHLMTGEASWIWCHINQETTVRDIRKANSEALDSRIILAAEKKLVFSSLKTNTLKGPKI
jgi:hypothetical protein